MTINFGFEGEELPLFGDFGGFPLPFSLSNGLGQGCHALFQIVLANTPCSELRLVHAIST